jgi:hypothetical protein
MYYKTQLSLYNNEVKVLWQKFIDGKISFKEYNDKRYELQKKIDAVREKRRIYMNDPMDSYRSRREEEAIRRLEEE